MIFGCVRRFRFPEEAHTRLREFFVLELFLQRNHLEGDGPINTRVSRQIYGAHGAATQAPLDHIPPEALGSTFGRLAEKDVAWFGPLSALEPVEDSFGTLRLCLFFKRQREFVHHGGERIARFAASEFRKRRLQSPRRQKIGAALEGIHPRRAQRAR